MKVVVDRSRCQSHGICETLSPVVFDLGADGTLTIDAAEVPDDEQQAVREAVDCCPALALRLEN